MKLICNKYGMEIVPESDIEEFYIEQFVEPVARLNYIREENFPKASHADEQPEPEISEKIIMTIQ
jgi:hypothetical protein